MTVVGQWDEEYGWVAGGERFGFAHDDEYTEDMMVERFSGPTYFARPVTVEKAYDSLSPPDFDVVNDVENDSDHPERDAPENEREQDRQEAEKDQVGPPMATLLGVGDDVNEESEGPDDEEDPLDEEVTKGRVEVDSVHDAPDEVVVEADVDEEGDVEGLYYEQE